MTGSQGTGKTKLTCEVVERMVAKNWRVLCTASTGVAAQNLRLPGVFASTVHKAWAFGSDAIASLNEHEEDGDVEAFMRSYDKKRRSTRDGFRRQLREAGLTTADLSGPNDLDAKFNAREGSLPAFLAGDLVVIDEVSMMSAFAIRVLDRVARWWMELGKTPMRPTTGDAAATAKATTGDAAAAAAPFGGLRVVFVGDLQQLPPIDRRRRRIQDGTGETREADLFFDATEWQDGTWVQRKLLLTRNWRQSKDPKYAATLERMANNALTEEDERLFRGAVLDEGYMGAVNPSVLPGVLRVFNTRAQCAAFSDSVLNAVYRRGSNVLLLERQEGWSIPRVDAEAAYGTERIRSRWDEHVRKVESELCREVFAGCPVFLRQNLDVSRGLVNGLRGCVVMLDEAGDPIVDFENDVGEFAVERIAKSTYLDDYSTRRRRAIESGEEAEDVGRPLVKADYKVHPLSNGFATTPWCVQGQTLDAVLYDPAVGMRDSWVPPEAFYVVASRVGVFGDNEKKRGPLRSVDGGEFKICRDPGLSAVSESLLRGEAGDPAATAAAETMDLNNAKGFFLTKFRKQSVYVRPRVVEYLESLKRDRESSSKSKRAQVVCPIAEGKPTPRQTARKKRGRTNDTDDKWKEKPEKKSKRATSLPPSSSSSKLPLPPLPSIEIERRPNIENRCTDETTDVRRTNDRDRKGQPSPRLSTRPRPFEWTKKEEDALGVAEHSAPCSSTSNEDECASKVATRDRLLSTEKRSPTRD